MAGASAGGRRSCWSYSPWPSADSGSITYGMSTDSGKGAAVSAASAGPVKIIVLACVPERDRGIDSARTARHSEETTKAVEPDDSDTPERTEGAPFGERRGATYLPTN